MPNDPSLRPHASPDLNSLLDCIEVFRRRAMEFVPHRLRLTRLSAAVRTAVETLEIRCLLSGSAPQFQPVRYEVRDDQLAVVADFARGLAES